MIGIVVLTVTALILSIILVLVDYLINKEDPKVKEIEELLPGLNCGTCGYGSCKGMATELLKDKSLYKNCRPLRGEKLEKFKKYFGDSID